MHDDGPGEAMRRFYRTCGRLVVRTSGQIGGVEGIAGARCIDWVGLHRGLDSVDLVRQRDQTAVFPHLYDDLADAEAMVVFRAGGGIFDKKYLHASSSVGNAISVRRKKRPP